MKTELKLAVFDVDGLMLDSEAFYANAWADAFNLNSKKEHRVNKKVLIKWFYNNLSGKKIGNQLDFIQSYYKNNDIKLIYEEYRKLFAKRINTDKVKVRKGFFYLIKFLKRNNIKLAIATTANLNTLSNLLKNSGIDISMFSVVVSSDLGLPYKPSPEPYLAACKLSNVDVSNVIAFEDSESGVMSACNAKLKCFLIPGRAPVNNNVKQASFCVCNNLKQCVRIIKNNFCF